MLGLQKGQFSSACDPTTLCVCILLWAVRRRRGQQQYACNPTTLCVCILLWAARGCAGLYFYAYDYSSWASTVMVFRNTSISRDFGWLQMNPYTNATVGRALYKTTFLMQNSTNGSLSSFNTSFVFSMDTERGKDYFGDGFAFLICPNPFRGEDLQVSSGGYLGMFNSSTNGLLKNRVFAIEFDTHQNALFKDPNNNHIGVDVNSLISLKTNNLSTLGIILNEGKRIICWIDYDGNKRYLRVYLAHSPSDKPSSPAIAMALDLAPYMKDNMYVGFTSATGTRAELHTIFSWWFLAGFGHLTLPASPLRSHTPLASLGQRRIIIAIFSLAVMVGFLSSFCMYARRRWQQQSKHLIDILLPVACWMYWKESIVSEVRSTRCLKLASPTVELLAWLWRTRLARRHDQPQVKTWPEMLKRKMGPHYRGEAWQLEDKRRKRRKPQGAIHVIVYENNESSSDVDNTRGKVKVIEHIRMMPMPERKVEETEVVERKEEAMVVPTPPVEQQHETKPGGKDRPALKAEGLARTILRGGAKGKDSYKDSKSYIIGSESFVVLEDESTLFQRRGSFLIPQGAPDDDHQLALEPAKDVPIATIPVVATPRAWPQREAAGSSKVTFSIEQRRPQKETVYISADDHTGDICRRGSFLIPQGAPDDDHQLTVEPLKDVPATTVPVVATTRPQPQQQARGPSKVKVAIERRRPQMETLYVSADDNTGHICRRGAFLIPQSAPDDDHQLTLELAKDVPAATVPVVATPQAQPQQEASGPSRVKFAIERRRPQTETVYISADDRTGDTFYMRRGSFSVHPEDGVDFTGTRSVEGTGNEPSLQFLVEHVDSNSNKGVDVRRGSFMMSRVEHDVETSSCRGMGARRGSFMLVEDEGSSKPGASNQILHSASSTGGDHSQAEGALDQLPKSPPHPSSSANDSGKSHVTHRWLFE